MQANTETEVNGVWMDTLGMSWGPVTPSQFPWDWMSRERNLEVGNIR